jgi:hypothetical protein
MNTKHDYQQTMDFEDEARRVAEAVWGLAPGECQPEHYADQMYLRELDGIVRLRDVTHLLMVTTSTRMDKIKSDVKKLGAAADVERRRSVLISKWIITSEQLNAEHINFARQHEVRVLTLDNFRNRFFDGRSYLSKRRVAPFGSARNLQDNSVTIGEDEYVEMPMTIQPFRHHGRPLSENLNATSVEDIVARLINREVMVMMAPFGSGKSLTTREIFLRLERLYNKRQLSTVPIVINLREHWGSVYADEILERHARAIGYTPKENLTLAWRAGIAMLLIDGFDEVASQVVANIENKAFMRDARRHALAGVQDLISNSPNTTGILVSGRDHYFDNLQELTHSLGLTGRSFAIVRLGEFTERQVEIFLERHNAQGVIPDWLPRKPLLLGYLAHSSLLSEVLKIDASQGFGYVWDEFLTKISEREAQVAKAVMDPATVRRVLERLACEVRSTLSGSGPIAGSDLAEVYYAETGQIAGEGVLMQLQRLPGLTERGHAEGARSFVDEDMLAALQGSAIANSVLYATRIGGKVWLDALSRKGIAMASYLLAREHTDVATVLTTAMRLSKGVSQERQLAADVVMIAVEMSRDNGYIDGIGIVLDGASVGSIDLEEIRIDNLQFRNSIIEEVILGLSGVKSKIGFVNCHIRRIGGASSTEGLPTSMFRDCEVEEYDDTTTNAAVLKMDWLPSLKALVTVLRKVYKQAGGGRKLGALKRGIPHGPVLDSVDEVIQILVGEEILTEFSEFVHPIRKQSARVEAILHAPNLSTDSIVQKVREIR